MSGKSPKPTDRRKAIGQLGENTAVRKLAAEGYSILHRNWRCRFGELDIVAEHEGTLVFVEVRTRTSGGRFGTAAESVDPRKQRQVRMVAEMYLRAGRLSGTPVRFDVVAISIEHATQIVTECRHIQGAF